MTLREGDRVPETVLRYLDGDGIRTVGTGELLAGRTVVLFGVPGAFTPGCSEVHLPGFVARADEIRARGVAEIVCVAVNDAFVVAAWGRSTGASDHLRMLADGNAELASAMGLAIDASAVGMGVRSRRFAAVVDDGVVRYLGVEPAREVGVSSADAILEALAASDRSA